VVVVGSGGTLLRWNGTVWSALGVDGYRGGFHAVVGSAANGGRRFLAGDDGLAQLDGTTLVRVATPYAPRLFAVALDAAGTPWTGGQRGLVMRGSGSSGSTLNLAADLHDVWVASASVAWAVGELGTAYRWNGSAWIREATPTTGTLFTVWAPSASEAFAGGDNGTMLRWSGGSWSPMTFPGTGSVRALWGTGPTNVVAATSAGEVLVYNGSAWRVAQTVPAILWSVWGTGPASLVVTGDAGAVQELDGSSWTTVPAPAPVTLAGSWSAGPGRLWVVGAAGDGTAGVAYQREGGRWSALATGTSSVLTSIWGPGQADLYVTGDAGTLVRFNGTTWAPMASGTGDLLWSVHGVPGVVGSAMAVGYNSTVVRGVAGSAVRWPAADGAAPDARPAGGTLEPGPGSRLVRRPLPAGAARGRRPGR
jgi:hypothetical protein